MGRIEIVGGKPLTGEIKVSGAKNEALKVIPLSLLIKNKFKISNVPDIADIRKQLEILEDLGGKYTFENNTLEIDGSTARGNTLKNGLATKLRASIVYLGPLLARFKEVTIPFPGGCAIGQRPIDSHIKAFEDLGATVVCEKESYRISFEEFVSSSVTLSEQSVTATENVLLFLSYFDEEFEMSNCAIEPEIMALCEVLNKAGAKVEISGDRKFKITGSSDLNLTEIEIIPDRIEAFSYLIAFLITSGSGSIVNFPAQFMKSPLQKLKEIGANFEFDGDKIIIHATESFLPFEIETAPYPGFPTDMQSPMSLMATRAQGVSKIKELMFENRLAYIEQLKKMGLDGQVDGSEAEITGPTSLNGTHIEALDLRSGITLVLAALAAQGKSVIEKGEIIGRGYENLEEKLSTLGADIKSYD